MEVELLFPWPVDIGYVGDEIDSLYNLMLM